VSIVTHTLPLVLSGAGALKGELPELQMVSEECKFMRVYLE